VAASFPVLTLEGSPSQRGLAYGRAAADRIRDGVDFYRNRIAEAGLNGARLQRAAGRLAEEVGRFDDGMLVELEAIAHGAEVTLGDVMSLNARSEMLRTAGEGCTAIACLPASTRNHHTLLAQNWDLHPSRVAAGVLLRILPDDAPGMLTFAEAGALARCGLNEAGVGVTGNALECEGGTRAGGVPIAALRRRILSCGTIAEALAAVRDAPRGTSVNHLIASAEGVAVACETTVDQVYEVAPEDGLLGHTNHFRAPRAQQELVDTGIGLHPDTLPRAERIRELVAARRPTDAADVQEALRDHEGHPDSICRHATTVDARTWTTLASVVMDLDERRMWLAAGPPCEGTFSEHRLTA
jgi:isopenicillin-N N-acyltransferase like protein